MFIILSTKKKNFFLFCFVSTKTLLFNESSPLISLFPSLDILVDILVMGGTTQQQILCCYCRWHKSSGNRSSMVDLFSDILELWKNKNNIKWKENKNFLERGIEKLNYLRHKNRCLRHCEKLFAVNCLQFRPMARINQVK